MADLGRIVVVQAGFALWQGGRCIAAGKWADIQSVRAARRADDDGVARLTVTLLDGTVLEMHEEAPGFDLFLERGSATLSGIVPKHTWHPALFNAAPSNEGILLYEKPAPRRPKLSR